MGPVVGVRRRGAGALGGGGPGRPEEETRHLRAPLGAGQGVLLHGEVLAGLVQRGHVAEELVVVQRGHRDRVGPHRGHRGHTRLGAVGVGAVLGLHAVAQHGLGGGVDVRKRLAVRALSGHVKPVEQLAVQPVGCPVGRLVGAVAPDGTQLHAAHRLPGGLSVEDAVVGEKHFTPCRGDLRGDGRRGAVDLGAVVAQQAEGDDEHADQREPELAVVTHGGPPASTEQQRRGGASVRWRRGVGVLWSWLFGTSESVSLPTSQAPGQGCRPIKSTTYTGHGFFDPSQMGFNSPVEGKYHHGP
ncbi:hypothetical protein D3C71_1141920 [compost metagenome]